MSSHSPAFITKPVVSFSHIAIKLIPFMPSVARFHAKLLPLSVQQIVAEFCLNKLLTEQIDDEALDFLADHWLEIRVNDIQQSWFFTFNQNLNKIQCKMAPQQANVSISGDFNIFVLLASQTVDPDTLFFKRQLVIQGDTNMGLEIKNMLDTVELTHLPKLITQCLSGYGNELNHYINNG